MFSFLLFDIVEEKNEESWSSLCRQYSDSISGNAEYMLKTLHQSLSQCTYNHSILTLAYSTEQNTSNISNAKIDFYHTADCNDLIDTAILYIPKLDLIIDTNSYNQYTKSSYPHASMLQDYENTDLTLISFNGVENFSNVFFYGDNLIIARDFLISGENRLGTIFYIVDDRVFYSKLCEGKLENSQIFICDTENTLLFESESSFTAGDAAELFTITDSAKNNTASLDNSQLFLSSSDKLGWKFLYIVDNNVISEQASLLLFLPRVLLIIVFALILSVFISCWLYQPFRMLITTLTPNVDTPIADPEMRLSEFDYFHHVYDQLLRQREHTEILLSSVSDDIVQRLFLDLFSNVQMKDSDISRYLGQINCPFHTDDFFKVMTICCEELPSGGKSAKAFFDQIRKISMQFSAENDCHIETVTPAHSILAVIFIFPKDISFLFAKKCISNLQNQIQVSAVSLSTSVGIGIGRFCSSVLDIKFSYNEALENSDKILHSSDINDTELSLENNNPSDELGFSSEIRAQQVIDEIISGNPTNAVSLSDRIIDNIFSDPSHSLNEQVHTYKIFVSALNDNIMAKVSPNDMQNFPVINPLLADITNSETISADALKESCTQLITSFSKVCKRQQNRYLIAAKDYIQKNYKDNNLTLNLCADAIGTSSSYLSRLFKTILGVNFNDYLNRLRIEYSEALLSETSLSVSEIAEKSGFNSAQSYIRVFKSHTGQTPGNYRKK